LKTQVARFTSHTEAAKHAARNGVEVNRNGYIRKLTTLGTSYLKNTTERENLRWQIAEFAFGLRGTFAAGQEKAALATAATAVQFSEGDVGNLIRAYEVKQDLTPAQAEKVSDWTTDAVLTLRGKDMTTGNRTKLISKAEAKNTRNVKTLREMKRGIVGSSPRNRANATDAKIALAKKLEKDFNRLLKSHDPVALAAGMQFAQDHSGQDVAAALLFHAAQVQKAAAVVA
jgi:hypothetical protein